MEHRLATGGADGLVFRRSATLPFDYSSTRARALRAWRLAGLEPIGMHECRHTFASLMIASGGNAKALSAYMGYASITSPSIADGPSAIGVEPSPLVGSEVDDDPIRRHGAIVGHSRGGAHSAGPISPPDVARLSARRRGRRPQDEPPVVEAALHAVAQTSSRSTPALSGG